MRLCARVSLPGGAQPPPQCRAPAGAETPSPSGKLCLGAAFSSGTWCTSPSLRGLMLVAIGDKMLDRTE